MNKSRKNHDQYTYIDTVVCVPGLHLGILLFKLKKRKIREKNFFPQMCKQVYLYHGELMAFASSQVLLLKELQFHLKDIYIHNRIKIDCFCHQTKRYSRSPFKQEGNYWSFWDELRPFFCLAFKGRKNKNKYCHRLLILIGQRIKKMFLWLLT